MTGPSERKRIYCDTNATTRISDVAFEAMLPFLRESYGNPSSIHGAGQTARAAVETARETIADVIGIRPAELVFTSCATESINSAIRGALDLDPKKRKVVVSAVEHSATLDVCERLESQGYEIVRLAVEKDGSLPIDRVASAIDDRTAVLSLLWVNNETGVFFDVERIGALARDRGVVFHVDAAQFIGKGMTGVRDLPIDLLSFSGHKFGAPKGTGGLYIRRGSPIRPLVWGGHHEKGRRGGTENVPGIVAMGAALPDYDQKFRAHAQELERRRDRLSAALVRGIPALVENGAGAKRLPTTLNVCFPEIEGAAMVLTLSQRGIYVSSGSACTATSAGPSHVLVAMQVPGHLIHGSVRYSFSPDISESEIDIVADESLKAFRHVSRVNT